MIITETERDHGTLGVTLYENGSPTSTKATLSATNGWTYTFSNLPKYKSGTQVNYSVQEDVPNGYTPSYSGNGTSNVVITNTHVPEKTEIKVTKTWNDAEDLDELRPNSITVKLLANGRDTGKTLTLNAKDNTVVGTFTNLYKYENGTEINYTIQEVGVPSGYASIITGDKTNGFTITNTHEPHYDGYIEISGKVWDDGEQGKANSIDGVFDAESDKLLEGIIVRIKDKNGNPIASSYYSGTGDNITYCGTEYAKTAKDGTYTIRVNYDNSQNVYKLYENKETVNQKLNNGAYVEFEYDGMKYTTVANVGDNGENTSKATENATKRNTLDKAHSLTNADTKHPNEWTDKNITAETTSILSYAHSDQNKEFVLKYCNGNGSYIRTNPNGAWNNVILQTGGLACNSGTGHNLRTYGITVTEIPNISLGLFKREQPDVAIFSDLTKVEASMNNQKYTYLYGVRTSELQTGDGLKVKFQNKGTYTYRRPVNPADIAFIQEPANSNKMEVLATYQVKLANLSATLPITFNEIINAYDTQYQIESVVIGEGDNKRDAIINNTSKIYQSEGKFNEIRLSDLNITLQPSSEAINDDEHNEIITITYKVSQDAIKGLLDNEATLNNVVEINSFTTEYGATTVYAEGKTGGRTNQEYAGYDYNSHPGNANIKLRNNGDGVERLYPTDSSGNIIPTADVEDDTDMAPSFVLCLGKTKTIAGTVWEDADVDPTDKERLGNGRHETSEKGVENVKIELHNLDGTIAQIYDGENFKDAVIYSKSDGSYKIEGVVTNEYYIKYTYGNDTEQDKATTMDGGNSKVNARNYKSTIITDDSIKNILNKDYENFSPQEKMWHITHQAGYSVAVDNMEERLKVEDLTYNNFDNPLNMTSYTKPFVTQLEFETTGKSQVTTSPDEVANKVINGNFGVERELNNFDFGIAERPREDIYAQKTITYFRITLQNGQVITEGNPSESNSIPFAKAMGFRQVINSGEAARNALEKQLLVEMDTELLQGAKLEAQYAVTIVNNSEKDFDYGNKDDIDYKNEFGNTSKAEYDKLITRNPKANYYYYGDSDGLNQIETVIKFVDYLSDGMDHVDNGEWTVTDVTGLVSDGTKEELSKNMCKTFTNKDQVVTLAREKTSDPIYMIANKVLANKDENVYSNSVEILSIDGKSARTIEGTRDGVQIEKSYKPGNYVPSSSSNTSEQDDDRVKITITPPTGATNYITTYVITALVGLVIISLGVIFIKKKVLIK